MHAILVYFHFTRPIEEYNQFFATIISESHSNYIKTNNLILFMGYASPINLRTALLKRMYKGDELFISEFNDRSAGKMPPSVREWLKRNVFVKPPVVRDMTSQYPTDAKLRHCCKDFIDPRY